MSIHELQAALRALDGPQSDSWELAVKRQAVIEEARRVAEGAGEPVASEDPATISVEVVWKALRENCERYRQRCLSERQRKERDCMRAEAAALLDAMRIIVNAADSDALTRADIERGRDALDAALATHKENTDER